MMVLGIETSCDETAAALLQDGRRVLSSVVASQIPVHQEYGGVVPELASREHVQNISTVVDYCFQEAIRKGSPAGWRDVAGIAVTQGPGLMGALLVGLAYAKAAAYALEVPFVGVNHLEGHLYSIFLDHPEAELPALSLVVSGGHTSLFKLPELGHYREISRTRDDAAGEALDKLSKFLGLGYPGGPVIDQLAPHGDPLSFSFTLPKISDGALDFSFSGMKTAALRYVEERGIEPVNLPQPVDWRQLPQVVLDLVASYQASIVDQILDRLTRTAERLRAIRSVQISGGVACNSELRRRCSERFQNLGLPAYFPRPSLTTDNALMIAAAGSLRLQAGGVDAWNLPADPNLPLTSTKTPV